MLIDRDVYFRVDENAVHIDNAFGFADFNSKYNVFKGQEISELIMFIAKCRSTPLRDNLPEDLIKRNKRKIRKIYPIKREP